MQPARTPVHIRLVLVLASLAWLFCAASCAARETQTSMEEDTLVVSPEPPMVLKVDKDFVYAGEVSIGPETTGEPLGLTLNEQVFFDVDESGLIRRAVTIGTMLPPQGASFNDLIWVPTEQLVYGGEIFGGLDFRGRTVAVPVEEDFYLIETAGESGYTFPELLLVRELGLLVDDAGVFLISYAEALDGDLEEWGSVEALDERQTSRLLDMSRRLRGSVEAVSPGEGLPGEPPAESQLPDSVPEQERGDGELNMPPWPSEHPADPDRFPAYDPAWSPV